MNRNKDHDSYIKYISVIDLIIKNSDEKNPITNNQIQDLIYDKGYDFKIDFRIVKKFVENYNNYYEDTIIKTYKEGRKMCIRDSISIVFETATAEDIIMHILDLPTDIFNEIGRASCRERV